MCDVGEYLKVVEYELLLVSRLLVGLILQLLLSLKVKLSYFLDAVLGNGVFVPDSRKGLVHLMAYPLI